MAEHLALATETTIETEREYLMFPHLEQDFGKHRIPTERPWEDGLDPEDRITADHLAPANEMTEALEDAAKNKRYFAPGGRHRYSITFDIAVQRGTLYTALQAPAPVSAWDNSWLTADDRKAWN